MKTEGYAFWCWIKVLAKDGAVIFNRQDGGCRLPFVPVPGMKLAFEENEDAQEHVIKSVSWCFPQDCFWIELEPDSSLMDDEECQCTSKDNCCVILGDSSYREALWLKKGWEIMEEWPWPDDDD